MSETKRKFSLWLSKDQAERFETVFKRAKTRDGRTNYSEVMKELMGFPPDVGIKPVTTEADRRFLAAPRHGPFLRAKKEQGANGD